ncbi:AAA family ATPase [uncultured Thiodictyon sp.]|uniref:AAA family ATPase n=1 Tax=uncultured Thiodictyon sp. TaxID=1846217 RepID=UPI0025EEA1D7|nr:AAA family ATPase [uncultured Thiodictyon sp.]
MRLTRLTLKNFRCFDTLTIAFDEDLTVLIAPNGQGKTTILDAIRIALWPYVNAFDVVSGTMPGSGIDIDDVMIHSAGQATPQNMEPRLPSVISASAVIGGQEIDWCRSREKVSGGSKTTTRDAKPLAETGSAYQSKIRLDDECDSETSKEFQLPVLAYYGTGRLWIRRKLTPQRQTSSSVFSRTYAYLGCLDSASDYASFMDWFFYNFTGDFEEKTKKFEREGMLGLFQSSTPYSEILGAVSNSVDQLMRDAGWSGLRYSPAKQTLVMSHAELGELKVDQLSDGQRNMVAMVGDIAYRCVRLNPHLGARAPLETEGIVLIDEIDMHLHPQWQQVVLAGFQEAFPKIQFIVTTHSPQVLTSIHKEHIRTLGKNIDGAYVASMPLAASYGEISSDVLESIMLVDPQPPIKERPDLKRLVELVDQGQYETDEAKGLLGRLNDQLRPDHPQLQRVERSIRRQQALKR